MKIGIFGHEWRWTPAAGAARSGSIVLFVLALALPCLAQSATYELASTKPQGVLDYFLTCPYLAISDQPDSPLLDVLDTPSARPKAGFAAKAALMSGNVTGTRVEDPIVDIKNAFLSVKAGSNKAEWGIELTFVYFDLADKTRVPAFRYRYWEGASESVKWRFFAVRGGSWTPYREDEILPRDWKASLLGGQASPAELDLLAVVSWDIDLPEFGTTIHLIPTMPAFDVTPRELKVPGTSRRVKTADLGRFFDERIKDNSLELAWNKGAGRFDPGRVVAWSSPEGAEPRREDAILADPQTVDEAFLACPDLGFHEGSLDYLPLEEGESRDAIETRYADKLNLLDGRNQDEGVIVKGVLVDRPGRFLRVRTSNAEWTMALFPGAADTSYAAWAYVFSYPGQTPQYNWMFYRIVNGEWSAIVEDALFPPGWPDALIPASANSAERKLLENAQWQLGLGPGGAKLAFWPVGIDELAPGLPADPERAYGDLVAKYLDGKEAEFAWDAKAGRLGGFRLADRPGSGAGSGAGAGAGAGAGTSAAAGDGDGAPRAAH
jgi:hypothetical protein